MLTSGQFNSVAILWTEQLPVYVQLPLRRGDVMLLGVLSAGHGEVHAI